jgi:hypothetical protein
MIIQKTTFAFHKTFLGTGGENDNIRKVIA